MSLFLPCKRNKRTNYQINKIMQQSLTQNENVDIIDSSKFRYMIDQLSPTSKVQSINVEKESEEDPDQELDLETEQDLPEIDRIELSDHLNTFNIKSPLSGVSRAYYLNLKRSIDRREHMETVISNPIFSNIPVNRIESIDGSDPSFNLSDYIHFKKLNDDINISMKNVEYATTLSHVKAIHRFVLDVEKNKLSKNSVALIMEDDVSTEFVQYWPKSLFDLIKEGEKSGSLSKDWEVLQLSYSLFKKIPKGEPVGALFEPWVMHYCGAIAYLIRYPAAVRFMQFLIGTDDSDKNIYIKNKTINHQADLMFYEFLRTYTIIPPLFTYRDSNDSTIHSEHLNSHEISKEWTKRMWLEYFQ